MRASVVAVLASVVAVGCAGTEIVVNEPFARAAAPEAPEARAPLGAIETEPAAFDMVDAEPATFEAIDAGPVAFEAIEVEPAARGARETEPAAFDAGDVETVDVAALAAAQRGVVCRDQRRPGSRIVVGRVCRPRATTGISSETLRELGRELSGNGFAPGWKSQAQIDAESAAGVPVY